VEANNSETQPEPKASRPHMPGYGVLGAEDGKGLLPWRWATERLTSSHNYWVATGRPDGRPHLMPVWGLWLDGAFYFSTGRESRKAKNLARDSHCVITTERADEAVIIEGVAREIPFETLPPQFVTVFKEKYDWTMNGDEGPVYAVVPQVAFGFIETGGDFLGTATRWVFADS
jgi:pyridoxamine 5'-phosphate oxidase-like protein